MHIAVVGAGAVGGYYGARLARSGERVSLIARGAHLRAIRERGLLVWSPLGDHVVRVEAESDPARVGPVDLVILAVKTYANAQVLPLLPALCGPETVVLTLQNGVASADALAGAVGEARVLAGTTYVATAIIAPGLIQQTGVHRRVILGEAFGERRDVSERAARDRGCPGPRRRPRRSGAGRPRAGLGKAGLPGHVRRLHRRRAQAGRRDLGRRDRASRPSSTSPRRSRRWRAPKACRSPRTSSRA